MTKKLKMHFSINIFLLILGISLCLNSYAMYNPQINGGMHQEEDIQEYYSGQDDDEDESEDKDQAEEKFEKGETIYENEKDSLLEGNCNISLLDKAVVVTGKLSEKVAPYVRAIASSKFGSVCKAGLNKTTSTFKSGWNKTSTKLKGLKDDPQAVLDVLQPLAQISSTMLPHDFTSHDNEERLTEYIVNPILVPAYNKCAEVATPAYPACSQACGSAGSKIKEIASSGVSIAGNVVGTFGAGIVEGVSKYPAVQTMVEVGREKAAEKIEALTNRAEEKLDAMINVVDAKVEQKLVYLSGKVDGLVDTVREDINGLVDTLTEKTDTLIVRVNHAATEVMSNANNIVTAQLTEINNIVLNQVENLDARIHQQFVDAEQMVNRTVERQAANLEAVVNRTVAAQAANLEAVVNRTAERQAANLETIVNRTVETQTRNLEGVIDRQRDSLSREMSNQIGNIDNRVSNLVTKIKWAGLGGGAGLIAMWNMGKFMYNRADHHLKKSLLIAKSSEKSMWQKFKGLFNKEEEAKKLGIENLIFSPSLEQRLNNVINTTRMIAQKIKNGQKSINFRNLFLWGVPGTGKTSFAQIIAEGAGLDYIIINGSALSQYKNGEGVTIIKELFDYVNKMGNMLVVIDEADAIFLNREQANIEGDAYQNLTELLNRIGQPSNKFMVALITNHPSNFDKALGRRITDSIEIKLPGLVERNRILKLYRNKILLNSEGFFNEFTKSVNLYFNDSKINNISSRTEGFSGAELESLVNVIKTDADVTPEGILSDDIVNRALHQAWQKHQEFDMQFRAVSNSTDVSFDLESADNNASLPAAQVA